MTSKAFWVLCIVVLIADFTFSIPQEEGKDCNGNEDKLPSPASSTRNVNEEEPEVPKTPEDISKPILDARRRRQLGDPTSTTPKYPRGVQPLSGQVNSQPSGQPEGIQTIPGQYGGQGDLYKPDSRQKRQVETTTTTKIPLGIRPLSGTTEGQETYYGQVGRYPTQQRPGIEIRDRRQVDTSTSTTTRLPPGVFPASGAQSNQRGSSFDQPGRYDSQQQYGSHGQPVQTQPGQYGSQYGQYDQPSGGSAYQSEYRPAGSFRRKRQADTTSTSTTTTQLPPGIYSQSNSGSNPAGGAFVQPTGTQSQAGRYDYQPQGQQYDQYGQPGGVQTQPGRYDNQQYGQPGFGDAQRSDQYNKPATGVREKREATTTTTSTTTTRLPPGIHSQSSSGVNQPGSSTGQSSGSQNQQHGQYGQPGGVQTQPSRSDSQHYGQPGLGGAQQGDYNRPATGLREKRQVDTTSTSTTTTQLPPGIYSQSGSGSNQYQPGHYDSQQTQRYGQHGQLGETRPEPARYDSGQPRVDGVQQSDTYNRQGTGLRKKRQVDTTSTSTTTTTKLPPGIYSQSNTGFDQQPVAGSGQTGGSQPQAGRYDYYHPEGQQYGQAGVGQQSEQFNRPGTGLREKRDSVNAFTTTSSPIEHTGNDQKPESFPRSNRQVEKEAADGFNDSATSEPKTPKPEDKTDNPTSAAA